MSKYFKVQNMGRANHGLQVNGTASAKASVPIAQPLLAAEGPPSVTGNPLPERRRSLAAAGAIGVGTLGVTLWMAHAMNAADLFRLPSEHIVTGWSTCLLFIGFAVALALLTHHKISGKTKAAAIAWGALSLAAAWQLLAERTGFSLGIPGWDRWQDRMSWVTATGLLVTACSVLASILRPRTRPLLSWIALLLFAGAVLILLGYWYAIPFFYAGDVRPIGFLAAFGIAAVALALASIEGVEHPPLQSFFSNTIEARLLRLFVPLVVVLVVFNDILLYLISPFIATHPAVRDLFTVLIAAVLTGLVVGHVARRLGGELDFARLKKEQAEQKLRTLNIQLEERVEKRTGDLQKTNAKLIGAVSQMHRLERELVEVTAREHERIGRDLHDSIGQSITGIGFLSKALEEQMAATGDSRITHARQIRELAVQALQETRDLARGFFPVEIVNHGLGYALFEFAQTARRTFGVECFLLQGHGVRAIPRDTAVHLYRIAQEAVTNAVRHGKATEITISLENQVSLGRLSVWNNGRPFEQNTDGDGVGMTSMQQRAAAIGGTLSIQHIDEGVEVQCNFPGGTEEPGS